MNAKQNGCVHAQPRGTCVRTTNTQCSLRVALITEDESLRDTVGDALKSLAIQPRRFLTLWHFEQSSHADRCDILILEQQHEPRPDDPFLAKALQAPRRTRLILLAKSPTTRSIVTMMKAGVDSVLDKPVCHASLRRVIAGEDATLEPHGEVADGRVFAVRTAAMSKLTARQLRVAELIYLGRSNRQIAETLSIAVKTVESHRTQIMHRLKVRSAAALIRLMGSQKYR